MDATSIHSHSFLCTELSVVASVCALFLFCFFLVKMMYVDFSVFFPFFFAYLIFFILRFFL